MENEDGEDDDEYDFMGLYDDAPDLDIPYDLIAELEAVSQIDSLVRITSHFCFDE
jgi:hypothetical protein